MPDLALSELILGAAAALGMGGTAGATLRKQRTPEDHEQRIVKLEERMATTEKEVAGIGGALAPLTVSVNRLTESIDGLQAKITELDVEARVERELRRRRPKTDTDPDNGG